MSYLNDLPLPDFQLREGDIDPVDFTLRHSDGTPVDLGSGRVVELRLLPYRGTQTVKTFRSDAATNGALLAITITTPAAGAIMFTNPTTPAANSGLLYAAERYHGYFAVYEATGVYAKTVPQARELWLEMLPRFA